MPPGPRGALWKGLLLAAIVAAGLALWRYTPLGELLDREVLVARLEAVRESSWAWPAMFGLLALVGMIGAPITPLLLANGAIFGFLGGYVANLGALVLAGLGGFSIARLLGRDLFLLVLRRTGLERIEATLERHGFWSLVRIRFLPIPFGILNYASGLTAMPVGRFLGATSLTMVPVLAVYTYLGHALMGVAVEDKKGLLWTAGAGLVALFLLSWLPGRKLRREVAIDDEPGAAR